MNENLKVLTREQAQEIYQKIENRQVRYTESIRDSVITVLMNYGDDETVVWCTHGEWTGTKATIPPLTTMIPLCPKGHAILESNYRKRLGIIDQKVAK